jgi:hypothetical protein
MSATKLSRRRAPKPDRRRALELLAGSRDGMTEAMLLAHGFAVDMLVDLIRAGLATANTERMVAGGRPIEVTRVRITDAGQRTHEDRTPTHGYEATREAAMTAFGKSWRRE